MNRATMADPLRPRPAASRVGIDAASLPRAAATGRPSVRFIHNYYYPDLSSVSQVITDIAAHLAREGSSVAVVASRNLYGGGDASGLAVRERLDGVRVRRVWGPSFGRLSLPGRVMDQLAFMIGATRSALFAPRVDTVVLLTNPPFFALLGMLLRRLRGERFVHVVMDLYPDIAVQSGHLRARSPLTALLRAITRRTLRSAHRVVVLGECMRDRVIGYGADPARIEVIRNWADEAAVRPLRHEDNPFRRSMGWEGKFVLMYSGNLGVAHAFDDILEVARRLRDRDDIVFAFIGDGVRRGEVEAAKTREGLGNVQLLPYQDRESLPWSLGAADAHLISLRKGFEGLVVPSKAYGVMAAGRPIVYVGEPEGEVGRMVTDEEIGFLVRPGEADRLEEVLLRLAGDAALRARLGGKAREVLLSRYSREAALARYRDVLLGEAG